MNWKDFAFWKKKKKADLPPEDLIKILIDKCCKVLIENKKFPNSVCFDIPRSPHLAYINITKDLIHEGEWRLQVGVMEDGSDKMFSIFLNHDTKENLLELLNSAQVRDEIFDAVKSLHARAENDD